MKSESRRGRLESRPGTLGQQSRKGESRHHVDRRCFPSRSGRRLTGRAGLVADKTIRDQEDQLRRLLNPAEEDLRQDLRLTPLDQPVVTLEPISLQEAIDIAIEQRPEIVQAKKNIEYERTQYQVRQESDSPDPLVPRHDGTRRAREKTTATR